MDVGGQFAVGELGHLETGRHAQTVVRVGGVSQRGAGQQGQESEERQERSARQSHHFFPRGERTQRNPVCDRLVLGSPCPRAPAR